MANFLQALSNFIRGVAALILAVVLSIAGFLGYNVYYSRDQLSEQLKQSAAEVAKSKEQIAQLQQEMTEKDQRIDKLDMALRLLKVDHRVAEIVALDQRKSEVADRVKTKVLFRDVDDQGHNLDPMPKVFTIDGDLVYVDAWVVKYSDELIESGDPLRSTSVCLFRRLFGEHQEPSEGFPLDSANSRPVAYGGGPMNDYEKRLWENFWEYANNPAAAKSAGVRAAHGEAPSIKLRPGKLYKLVLRSSGGLSIETEELPIDYKRPL